MIVMTSVILTADVIESMILSYLNFFPSESFEVSNLHVGVFDHNQAYG
jgi:hypothetical protein